MSASQKEKKSFFLDFTRDISKMLGDIFFVYKHFIHWNISKICISLWSILLGIIIALPFFTAAMFVGFFDPIDWLKVISGANPEHDILIESLAMHPFALITMIFFIITTILSFLMGSSFSLFLQTRLALKYTEKKLLKFKKNFYCSRKHFVTFLSLISWNFLYLLSPCMIWGGGVYFLYRAYQENIIALNTVSYSLLGMSILLLLALAYVSYRILFGYVILAEEKKEDFAHKARYYLYTSIELTKGKNIWKFIGVMFLYTLVLSPFRVSEQYLSDGARAMRDALAFKSQLVENIDAKDVSYFEYITREYKDYSQEQLVKNIILFTRLNFVLYFLTYFLVGGLFVVTLSSFYKRVLKNNLPSTLEKNGKF